MRAPATRVRESREWILLRGVGSDCVVIMTTHLPCYSPQYALVDTRMNGWNDHPPRQGLQPLLKRQTSTAEASCVDDQPYSRHKLLARCSTIADQTTTSNILVPLSLPFLPLRLFFVSATHSLSPSCHNQILVFRNSSLPSLHSFLINCSSASTGRGSWLWAVQWRSSVAFRPQPPSKRTDETVSG